MDRESFGRTLEQMLDQKTLYGSILSWGYAGDGWYRIRLSSGEVIRMMVTGA